MHRCVTRERSHARAPSAAPLPRCRAHLGQVAAHRRSVLRSSMTAWRTSTILGPCYSNSAATARRTHSGLYLTLRGASDTAAPPPLETENYALGAASVKMPRGEPVRDTSCCEINNLFSQEAERAPCNLAISGT